MIPQSLPPHVYFLTAAVFVVGVLAFARGLAAYRKGARVASIATSRVSALAAGEVRLTGVVEPLVNTLISPLQSEPCVWYRSSIAETGRNARELLREERAVEFGLRDETGLVRVVPRAARWEIGPAWDETTDMLGDEPAGLHRRQGPASTVLPEVDREAAIANLLTVHPPAPVADGGADPLFGVGGMAGLTEPRKRYREWRLAPGETVTVVGCAMPHGEIVGNGTIFASTEGLDADLLADLAEARAAGRLASSPEEAWGNAAIPGFGIGRPVEAPVLDPGVHPPEAPDPDQAVRAEQLFEVPDHELVISAGPGAPLSIYAGVPAEAKGREDRAFVMGLGGALLATASALVFAVLVTGRL